MVKSFCRIPYKKLETAMYALFSETAEVSRWGQGETTEWGEDGRTLTVIYPAMPCRLSGKRMQPDNQTPGPDAIDYWLLLLYPPEYHLEPSDVIRIGGAEFRAGAPVEYLSHGEALVRRKEWSHA